MGKGSGRNGRDLFQVPKYNSKRWFQVRSCPPSGLLTIPCCLWNKAHTSWSGCYLSLRVLLVLSPYTAFQPQQTASHNGIYPALFLPGLSLSLTFLLRLPKWIQMLASMWILLCLSQSKPGISEPTAPWALSWCRGEYIMLCSRCEHWVFHHTLAFTPSSAIYFFGQGIREALEGTVKSIDSGTIQLDRGTLDWTLGPIVSTYVKWG